MHKKQSDLEKIVSILEEYEIEDQIELIANLCLHSGCVAMHKPASIDQKQIIEYVLNDIKSNGNTIGNSLAMQGITIFEWLSRN